MATPNGRGGWDLTDEDADEVIEAMTLGFHTVLGWVEFRSPVAAALADAWDQGYEQGAGEVRGEDEKPNPYRP